MTIIFSTQYAFDANKSKYITDIQICNVKPVASRRQWPSGTPEQVKRFYACNDVDTFLCDRPLQKPPIDKDNEFKVKAT